MDKKGFLLAEETLKVIIAAICIIFLIVLIIAVYNAITGSKKTEQAQENLNRINDIIVSLENGESENKDITNPEGWHLLGFVYGNKPNSCLNNNCLCICKGTDAEKCDKRGKGSCLIVTNLTNSNLDIKIKGPSDLTFINIKKQENKILITEV
jgi:type II secretory pathway pseudopilin PulG